MAKHRDEFELCLSLEDAAKACQEAIGTLGWRVLRQTRARLVGKEAFTFGFTWPAQVEILLTAKSSDATGVTLNGSIFGLGPIQSGHLRKQVENLRNSIELAASSATPAQVCQHCGRQLLEGARFCPTCGKEVAVQVCQACGAKLIEGAHFCQRCGTSLSSPLPPKSPVLCPKCGTENLPTSKFCQKCGISLAPAALSSQSRNKQKQYPEPQRHAIIKEKEKARPRRLTVVSKVLGVVIGVVIFIGVILFFLGQSLGEETPVQSVISRDDALSLATNRVQEDGVMSLDGRKTTVKEEPNQWHISFPLSATMVRGGEPHVIIDKASGAITDVYYTK